MFVETKKLKISLTLACRVRKVAVFVAQSYYEAAKPKTKHA